jgi:uncharacterized protein YndB with AHSA1/START domain
VAKTHGFVIDVVAPAPPERVFSLLADAPGWKEWGGVMIARSRWEREGAPEAGGVGAVRAVGRFPFVAREEIVAYDPPRHLAYTLVSGLPRRSYRADVTFSAVDGGTQIHWTGEFVPSIPGTGGLFTAVLRTAVANLASHLVKAAHGA